MPTLCEQARAAVAPEMRCEGTTSEHDAHSMAATPPPVKPFRMMTMMYTHRSVTENTMAPKMTALIMQKIRTLRRDLMASEILPAMGLKHMPQNAPALTRPVPTMSGALRFAVM